MKFLLDLCQQIIALVMCTHGFMLISLIVTFDMTPVSAPMLQKDILKTKETIVTICLFLTFIILDITV